jgi:ferredoxin
MWTKMMSGPRKKAPKTIAVIDPDRCFGAFACSICQAACPVADCIVEEPDRDGRMVCAVRADLCIGCGLCVDSCAFGALSMRQVPPPEFIPA